MARRQRHAHASPRRVKQHATYDVAEAAKLLGVHRNTVRRWLKDGLEPIDGRRPLLIHGAQLKAFLSRRRQNRKHACRPGEFFCFRCRAPRAAWGGAADMMPRNDTVARLVALCACCGTPMHRAIRTADLPAFALLIDLKTLDQERLNKCSTAT